MSGQYQNVGGTERLLSTLVGTGLLIYFVKKPSLPSILAGIVGVDLLYRGATGHCPVYQRLGINTYEDMNQPIELRRAVTVNRPRQEVYDYWRTLENLPNFMDHVDSVRTLGEGKSHWRVHISPKLTLEWDAQITQERDGERIAWRSLPGSAVENWGSVEFADAPDGRGTEVLVTLRYQPPAGVAGRAFEALHKAVTAQQMKEDMRHFKQILETGERPTTEGQPVGAT